MTTILFSCLFIGRSAFPAGDTVSGYQACVLGALAACDSAGFCPDRLPALWSGEPRYRNLFPAKRRCGNTWFTTVLDVLRPSQIALVRSGDRQPGLDVFIRLIFERCRSKPIRAEV